MKIILRLTFALISLCAFALGGDDGSVGGHGLQQLAGLAAACPRLHQHRDKRGHVGDRGAGRERPEWLF